MKRPLPSYRRAGLSLVQVLVASAVLVVGLLPLFTIFSSSVRTTEVSIDELRAAYLAEEALDQLRLLAFVPGLSEVPDLPLVNPAPYELAVDTSDKQGQHYQSGMALPHPIKGTGQVLEVPTDDWQSLGASVTPGADTTLEALGRLYLSPLPKGYKRRIRLFAPPIDASGTLHPGLRRVEVEIEWDRTFMGMEGPRTRVLRLTSLVSDPGGLR